MDFSFPIRAAHSSLTDNRLAKSASVISGSSSPLSSSQSLAVSVSTKAAKAHSHTSLDHTYWRNEGNSRGSSHAHQGPVPGI
jgi:hypothetical protein